MMKVLKTAALFPPRPTALAHQILAEKLNAGDWVIDATAGNGYDTRFLAECVGRNGRVFAFDVQGAAIVASRSRVSEAGCAEWVEFFQDSHANLECYVTAGSIHTVVFNLGYLPGEDHGRTTESGETLLALAAAERVLRRPGGVISVICYPGHAAGETEAAAVEGWMLERATRGWRVAKYAMLGTQRKAPFLLVAQSSET